MKAKSRAHYIEAWTEHLNQLIHVAMDADLPIEGWTEMKEELQDLIEVAANKLFPEDAIDCGACTVAIGGHTMRRGCREFEGEQS